MIREAANEQASQIAKPKIRDEETKSQDSYEVALILYLFNVQESC